MNKWSEIAAWRKERRTELIAQRVALEPGVRAAATQSVTRLLTEGFAVGAGTVVAFCWPYKGELDARFAVRQWRERGAVAALPEVTGRESPLRFRQWWPGAPMKAGVMGIPIPDGTEIVVPDMALVPMVGWDERGYRLGYGGGYFDVTLAALAPRPIAIGVSQELFRLETIFPVTHDIAMDFVVTEAAIYRAGGNALQPVTAERARRTFVDLLAERCLPHNDVPGAVPGSEPGK
jgi:5-formyltetrahydrofolate cyclo-ligase